MRIRSRHTLSSFLGEKPSRYVQFYAVSKESRDHAEKFKARACDVIVATYSKTGTTLVQQMCQQIRTPESFDDEKAMEFEEITQVQPWIDFAHDIQLDLDEDQAFEPRVFKSHQPLESINRGAKYIATIRDPKDVARSYYYFYREKDHPSTRNQTLEMWTKTWSQKGTWCDPIWGFLNTFALTAHLSNVLILPYEDIVASPEIAIRAVAAHMGHKKLLSRDRLNQICRRCSREFMSSYSNKFDDHYLEEEQRQHGCKHVLTSSRKVVSSKHQTKREHLDAKSKSMLEKCWTESVTPKTGFKNYGEMRKSLWQQVLNKLEKGATKRKYDKSRKKKNVKVSKRKFVKVCKDN